MISKVRRDVSNDSCSSHNESSSKDDSITNSVDGPIVLTRLIKEVLRNFAVNNG